MSHRHRSPRSIRGFWEHHRSSRAFRHGTVAAAALVTFGAAVGVLLANNQGDSGRRATPSAIQADGSLYPPTPSVAFSPHPGATARPDGSPSVPGPASANPLSGADAGIAGQPAPTLGTGPGAGSAGTHASSPAGRSGGGAPQVTAASGGATYHFSTPGPRTSPGQPTTTTGPGPGSGPTTAGHDGANHSPAPQQPASKPPSSSPPKHSGSTGGSPSGGGGSPAGSSPPGSSAPDTPSQTPSSQAPRAPAPSQPAAAPPVDVPPSKPPVDNVAPQTTAATVSAANGVWSIRLGADESAYFECNLDGTGWRSCSANPSYTNMHPGPHTFSARATDLAGNTDPTPAVLTIKFTGNGSAR